MPCVKVARMATRLVHMVIDAHDTSRLAQFWAGALDWEVGVDEPGEAIECISIWLPSRWHTSEN